MKEYIQPSPTREYYTCPHCNTFTMQIAVNTSLTSVTYYTDQINTRWLKTYTIKECSACKCIVCWDNDQMIYPELPVLEANPDMPESVKSLYEEAGLIVSKSPRAACALLRLAVEKLCLELGAQEKTINSNIAYLVSQGLPTNIQKALDFVRVVGNNAVHPGTIAFDVDEESTALALFKLLNLIVEKMITEPKEIDAVFDALPESAKNAINRRDANPTSS